MTLEEYFFDIQQQYDRKLPFVAYKKSGESLLKALLQDDTKLHFATDFTESGFVFSPFDDSLNSILIPISDSNQFQVEFVSSQNAKIKKAKPLVSEEKKSIHISLVSKAMDEIEQGELQKVVVSRSEIIPVSDSNPITIFQRLLNTYESAFVYCWYHPKVGLWLGATPETLLRIEGNRLFTMSLAGTQEFIDTEEVLWLEKERNEQQLVTDFIVESLRSSTNKIEVSDTKTVRAGNILHLKTDIQARLKPESLQLKKIVQNLHPTPAICGLPKVKAKHFILKNEGYSREYYAGFLGELNFKEKTSRNSNRRNVENNAYASIKTVSNLYVNLRCMQLKDDQAYIYVGGGITKDSVPEGEWEETVSKSQVIKSVL